MSEVVRMTHHHTAQIASLHINNLHTNFRGRSGNRLLEIYYRSLVSSSGGVGFVALIDNDVVGYICGIWDAAICSERIDQDTFGHIYYFG